MFLSRSLCFTLCVVAYLAVPPFARAAELQLPHVNVTYEGIDVVHARAIARTVEAARTICAESYGFEMPETIRVNVTAVPGSAVRLFNDGVDTFSLSLRSEADLRRPAVTGTFQLYGLCHEVAHLAMYRPIADHRWLSTAGAEGWAHYLGSVLVDDVYAQEGADLWSDPYDYRADGTRRLEEQLAKANPSDIARGAGLWRALMKAVGREQVPALFAAWGRAKIDLADPATALKAEQVKIADSPSLSDWWKEAGPLLFVQREASRFPKRQIAGESLTGGPRTLAHDDGESAGKSSIAGGGHAVRFRIADASWFLTGIEIYGARYGAPAPPKEKFHVWLCDDQFRSIAEFEFPYAEFDRGEPNWVTLAIDPTNVPADFIVCVGFNPAAAKGVFVHYDAKTSGRSLTGLPGAKSQPFRRGDWMIRAHVDQPKDVNALSPLP